MTRDPLLNVICTLTLLDDTWPVIKMYLYNSLVI